MFLSESFGYIIHIMVITGTCFKFGSTVWCVCWWGPPRFIEVLTTQRVAATVYNLSSLRTLKVNHQLNHQ